MNEDKYLEEFVRENKDFRVDLNKKIEAEIAKRKNKKAPKIVEVTSIKDVRSDVLFSKNSFWIATNLATMIEFELNGLNVNMYIGENSSLRKLLVAGVSDGFTKNGLYIKFHHALQEKKG